MAEDEVWLHAKALPRPFVTCDLPRTDPGTGNPVGTLRLQLLSQGEQLECAIAAENYVKKHLPQALPGSEGRKDLYEEALTIEMLWRACRRAKTPEYPFFSTPRDVRDLSAEETGVLAELYKTARYRLGPVTESLSEEEFYAIVDQLAAEGPTADYASLSWDLRMEIVTRLARVVAGADA